MMLRRKTETDPAKMPLTFEILSDGDITWKAGQAAGARTIEYSKNGGEWTAITSTTAGVNIPVVAGDVVKFRGDVWPGSGSSSYSKFASTCTFAAKGNPASLVYGETLTGEESIVRYGYYSLFDGCMGLTQAPVLPATTLADYCYSSMFDSCTGLTSAPELPATTLADYCYQDMFYNCRSLTEAPELPATTLASYCYQAMFQNCVGLTSAPELPATTLASYCYQYMFSGCTGLTKAPELPATTLVSSCYSSMFRNCSRLVSIKCLATDISTTSALSNWLNSVAASGTFTKKAGVEWPSGTSGIPSGWTVVEV